MRVLFTIPSFEIGGAEIFLTRLCHVLIGEENMEVYVLDFEMEKRDPALVAQFDKKVNMLRMPQLSDFTLRLLGKWEKLTGKVPGSLISKIQAKKLEQLSTKN